MELLKEEARLGCIYLEWQQVCFIYFCNIGEYKFSCFRLKLARGHAETGSPRDKSLLKCVLYPQVEMEVLAIVKEKALACRGSDLSSSGH